MLDRAELRPTADALLRAAVGASTQTERMRLIDEAVRLHAEAVETYRALLQAETSWDLAADAADRYFRIPPDRPS